MLIPYVLKLLILQVLTYTLISQILIYTCYILMNLTLSYKIVLSLILLS